MSTREESIRGGIFGAALGDAVGLTYEGRTSDNSRIPEIRGGGQFNLALGSVTDDTLMTLALTDTYVQCGCFDRGTFLSLVIQTVQKDPVTFGRTTKTLVSFLESGMYPESAAKCVDMLFSSTTNGSVMRTLPVGLAAANPNTAAREVSAFTHISKEACDACAAVSTAAASLLAGAKKDEVLAAVPKEYLTGDCIPSVRAFDATRCAFDCFARAENFEEVIRRAICLGGDSDTIACIAGGLAGVLYGYDALPREWIEKLILRSRIEKSVNDFIARLNI